MANPTPTSGTVNPAQPKPTIVAGGPEKVTDGEDKAKKKEAKEKSSVARPRLARPDENHVITVLKPGIKTGKSGQRYDMYRNGMTVKEYVDLMTSEPWGRTVGQVYHTLRWDTDPNRKLIHIGPIVVPVPPPPPPKEAKKKKEEKAAEPSKQAS